MTLPRVVWCVRSISISRPSSPTTSSARRRPPISPKWSPFANGCYRKARAVPEDDLLPGSAPVRRVVSPNRRRILAGSRPGRRGTLVSAKVPKAICACAFARKSQRVPFTPHSSQGVQARHIPCPWPGRTESLPRPFRPDFAFFASLSCFARKTGIRHPWRTRSPGRRFTGSPPIIRLAPRRLARRKAPRKTNSNPALRRLVQTGGEVALLLNPLTQAERGVRAKGKHEVAGHGPPRSPQAQGPVPWANLLSRPTSEGTGRGCGRRPLLCVPALAA